MANVLAILTAVLSALIVIDKIAHTFGLTRVLANTLRDLAKKPGNKLAPVEDQIAAHLDAGDDAAALALAKTALGTFVGKK